MSDQFAARRLAAIMAVDVASYTRLMEEDTDGTVSAWKTARESVIDPIIGKVSAKIIKFTGDGFLAEFTSIRDAVNCAIDLQRALASNPLDFRMGIHLGDITNDGIDVHGEGVNIAARIEALAEPGGICISSSVYEQVRHRIEAVYIDMGDQTLKNVSEPIRTYAIRVGEFPSENIPSAPAQTPQPAEPDKPSIAVLPFVNLSGDDEQEYFSDGLTEDLITALTRWRSFHVIARNSCFTFKGTNKDIKHTAHALNAQYVLEGSVRKGGNRLRISAQLVNGNNGLHVWADKYDRNMDDIFDVQDEIVQKICSVVAPELDKAEVGRSTDKQVNDLSSWDLCLQAKALLHCHTRTDNLKARELFLRAINIQADYSDAYSGLAQSFNQDILFGGTEDRTATATEAMEAAQSAITYDRTSSWAHHELSTAYQWLDRLDDALDEIKAAVELNPNDSYTLHALGNKSDLAGDPNGIGLMEQAQKLNPEDSQRHTHLIFLARAYIAIGDFSTASDRARQAIRRQPDYPAAHYIMGIALTHLGQQEEAQASLKKCDALSPGFLKSRQSWHPYASEDKNKLLLCD